MTLNQEKGLFITILALAFGKIGIIAIPVLLLAVAMFVDYFTGVAAAKYRGLEKSSNTGIKGIVKKFGMLVVVGACLLLDILLIYASQMTGLSLPIYFVITCLVTIIMFCNEIISILENVLDMGVEVPTLLLPFVKNIRSKISEAAQDTVDQITESEDK